MKKEKPDPIVHGYFKPSVVKELGLKYDSTVMMILRQLSDLNFGNKPLNKESEIGYVKFWYSIDFYSKTLALNPQAMKRAFARMKKIKLLNYFYCPKTHLFQIALNVNLYTSLISSTHLMKAKKKTLEELNDILTMVFGAKDFDEKRFLNMLKSDIKKDSKLVKVRMNKKTNKSKKEPVDEIQADAQRAKERIKPLNKSEIILPEKLNTLQQKQLHEALNDY